MRKKHTLFWSMDLRALMGLVRQVKRPRPPRERRRRLQRLPRRLRLRLRRWLLRPRLRLLLPLRLRRRRRLRRLLRERWVNGDNVVGRGIQVLRLVRRRMCVLSCLFGGRNARQRRYLDIYLLECHLEAASVQLRGLCERGMVVHCICFLACVFR